MVLGYTSKLSSHGMGSKLRSSTPPWPRLQSLPLGSNLEFSATASLTMNCVAEFQVEINPFLTKLLWVMVFYQNNRSHNCNNGVEQDTELIVKLRAVIHILLSSS